jgi:hypothetical protein
LNWFQQIWAVLTSKSPDAHSDAEWIKAKVWYDSYEPKPDHDYTDTLQFAEKRYAEIVEADRKIDLKAEWLFGVAFAATGGCAAAIISSHVSLWWSLPTLIMLAMSMLTAIRVRLPSQREVPAKVRDAIAIDENEPCPKGILAANIHLACEANVVISAWKSSALLAATRLLFMATALFLLPLAQKSVSPADSIPQKSTMFRAGHISLELDLDSGSAVEGPHRPRGLPPPDREGPAK